MCKHHFLQQITEICGIVSGNFACLEVLLLFSFKSALNSQFMVGFWMKITERNRGTWLPKLRKYTGQLVLTGIVTDLNDLAVAIAQPVQFGGQQLKGNIAS